MTGIHTLRQTIDADDTFSISDCFQPFEYDDVYRWPSLSLNIYVSQPALRRHEPRAIIIYLDIATVVIFISI
jgi:hypothetical protein